MSKKWDEAIKTIQIEEIDDDKKAASSFSILEMKYLDLIIND